MNRGMNGFPPRRVNRRPPEVAVAGLSIAQWAIPSDATVIHIDMDGVSTNGTSSIFVRLGSGGNLLASGYYSASFTGNGTSGSDSANGSTGMMILSVNASDSRSGRMTLHRIGGGNKWSAAGLFKTSSITVSMCAGSVTLPGLIDSVAVVPGGSDDFDSGTISVSFE